VNAILLEAHSARTKRVPNPITCDEQRDMELLLQILEPVASLTDELQADTVTASLVIIGVMDCITRRFILLSWTMFCI
jgi:hypothetical protein